MNKVRLGIIGLGNIGNLHLANSLKLENARVAAVADVSEKALKAAKAVGVKNTYTDYEMLLADAEIDAVIIALPTFLHLQCATKAADKKKHILLEKPIARDVSEAKELVSVCDRNSVKLMMGYPLRFDPVYRELKLKIESGCLGKIEGAYAVNVGSGPFNERAEENAPIPVPEWWFNKKLAGGGALMDLGSHMIDLLRWYFGEVVDIQSFLSHHFNLDFEDDAICLAKFSSGTTAVIHTGWFSQVNALRVELLGTADHAEVRGAVRHRPIIANAQKLLTGSASRSSPFFNEINYFVNCILNDSNPSPSAVEGLKDLEAICLAYRNQILLCQEA